MDKHTPLTKLTKKESKHNPTGKKTIFKENIQNTKKSKASLLPAQKNKYHYIIEQNHYRENFLPRHG
jgi:protease II